MDAPLFKGILDKTILPGTSALYPGGSFKLYMDSDPKHTAKMITNHVDQIQVNYVKKTEWPANLPDLNPIENIWAELANRVNNNPPYTLSQLKRRINIQWKNIPQQLINTTILSMPARLKEVIKNKGAATRY